MPFGPHDAATDAIDRARAMLVGSRTTARVLLEVSDGRRRYRPERLPPDVRSDMRRLSVVMAVAALDTYMHRLILSNVYTHNELPGGLANLDVPFVDLLDQADKAGVAARRNPHPSRPRVAVKRQLRDRLLRETFQSYDSVSRALSMAGLSRKSRWSEIGENMNPPIAPKEIKERLNAIVVRRNQIVHEGDYERLERPQKSTRNGMPLGEAHVHVEFIARLIDGIHAVI